MTPRALIFAEDPFIRKMLKEICLRRGYEVLSYPEHGLCPLHMEGSCRCEEGTACSDFILTDLDPAGTEKLDHLQTLLTKGCQCRHIALLSGTWTPSEQARAEDLGCKLFLKPLDARNVTRWLDQAERELHLTRKLRDLESVPVPAED